MDQPALHLLILEKLADGRLPHDRVARMWGGPGSGETCDGCGEAVTLSELGMEAFDHAGRELQFHVGCLHVWDAERESPGNEPNSPCPQ